MEHEVRQLIEQHVADKLAVLEQVEASWSQQARRPTADEVDAWIAEGRR